MNFYNDIDEKACAWTRELIRTGLIPDGVVSCTPIQEINPYELTQFTQCHFFCGISGWSFALQLAGWPASRPVGTGSCPCQPFSCAGSQKGSADERHLWPAFFKLIRECRALGQRWTDAIFGEQVESAIAHGWLDEVSADMEGEGYALGAAILGAHSVGAPHRRQRLYWVAYADKGQCGREPVGEERKPDRDAAGRNESDGELESGCADSSMANPDGWQSGDGELQSSGQHGQQPEDGGAGSMDNADSSRLNGQKSAPEGAPRNETWMRVPSDGRPNGVAQGDTDDPGSQGRGLRPDDNAGSWAAWTTGVEFLACTDGRKRLIKSSIFPLAYGFSENLACMLSIEAQAWEKITQHAKNSKTNPDEILRMVRDGFREKPSRQEQSVGVCGQLHEASFLLYFLLRAEAARDRSSDGSGIQEEGHGLLEGAVRVLRGDHRAMRPSCGWKPDEQFPGEPPEALSVLSFFLARLAETYREKTITAHASLNRVALLRGSGNAIVPQVAAAFILAAEGARHGTGLVPTSPTPTMEIDW